LRIVYLLFGRSRTRTALTVMVLCLFIFFLIRGVHNLDKKVLSAELFSPDYPGRVIMKEEAVLKNLEKQVAEAKIIQRESGIIKGEQEINNGYRLLLRTKKETRTFVFEGPERLLEMRTGQLLLLRDRGECLKKALEELEKKNPYGEFLSWVEADKVFRKFDQARITDFETGMSFMVQRREGRFHADVQPLTAEDSAVMKTIYGGRWSWKRRAVIVEVKGRRIAASMNGMPHGAGAIEGNDFNGHFCIHFKDSRLHSGKVNLAHQLMTWKAAGKVEEMVQGYGPENIINVMLTAAEQGDMDLAARFVRPAKGLGNREVLDTLKTMKWFTVADIRPGNHQPGDIRVFEVKYSYGLTGGEQVLNRETVVEVIKVPGRIPWKVRSESVAEMLKKEDENPIL